MEELKKRIDSVKKKIDVGKINEEIAQIQSQSGNPDFWQDQVASASKMKQLAWLQKELAEIEELELLWEMQEYEQLEKQLEKVELKTFLSGEFDQLPALISIHSGQGGTEAMDWAAMVRRMYLRYFDRQQWGYELLDETFGDEAGIKSATYAVNAPFAYGYLRREAGTHRLVRQSPFNADKLRQTSFALVEVLPQIDQSQFDIAISEEDLEWQFYHSAGHGGQNVQKVATAVRLKHKPTGIIVTCQTERYQEQNRKNALNLLRAKLWEVEQKEREKQEKQLKGGRTQASWGTQIRSYVLHPYKLVKDTRTGYESTNPDLVLDGQLDDFITSQLKVID